MDATISELGRPEDTPTFNGAMPKVQVHTNVGRTFRSAIADFFDVYPLGREQSPVILAAMKLLQEARNTLDEAYRYRDMDDVVNADDCLLRLRALLPELFLCRSIGDGLGSVVLATLHSLENARAPLSKEQVAEIRSAFIKLQREPYMPFEAALNLQEQYERVGLEPDSEALGELGGHILAEEESVRRHDDPD